MNIRTILFLLTSFLILFPGATIGQPHPSDEYVEGSPISPPPGGNRAWGLGTPIPTGGQYQAGAVTTDCQNFYLIGGRDNSVYLNQNLYYDVAGGTWTTMAPMPSAGRGNLFAYYNPGDGLIYVPGGYDGSYRTDCEAYDPMTDSWAILPPLPIGKSGANGGIVDGMLYLFGGNGGGLTDETQIYDIAAGTWSMGTPMPAGNRYGGNVTHEGYIYVVGGWDSSIFYRYDPMTGTWEVGPSLNLVRNSPAVTVSTTGIIHARGGGDGWTAIYSGEYYDLANWPAGAWTLDLTDNQPLPNIRAGHVCASDLLWCMGGAPSPYHGDVQYWDGVGVCGCPSLFIAIPTLSTWGLIIFALALGTTVIWVLRRRKSMAQ